MKIDLNSLKTEINRLTDIKYLKKEINRIAGEVKRFDVQAHLTPQAKQRLEALEERFHDLMKNLQELQKQVDANFERLMSMVRGRRGTSKRTSGRRATKKTARKATAKRATRKAAK